MMESSRSPARNVVAFFAQRLPCLPLLAASPESSERWIALTLTLAGMIGWQSVRWFKRRRHWIRVLGPEGYGIEERDVIAWWRVASPELRGCPEEITRTQEAYCHCLEELRRFGHEKLVRRLHSIFERRHCRTCPTLTSELVVGSHVLVRNKVGTLLIEGMVRTVTEDDVAVLAYDEGAGLSDDAIDQRVYIETSNGMRVRARTVSCHGGILWRFQTNLPAETSQRRKSERVTIDLFAHVFPPSNAVASLRGRILRPHLAMHPLEIEGESEPAHRNFGAALRDGGIWHDGVVAHLDDISVGGALLHIYDLGREDLPETEKGIFIYLATSGEEGKIVDLLLPAARVTSWQEADESTRGEGWLLHVRFVGLDEYEIQQLWQIVRSNDRKKRALAAPPKAAAPVA